MKNFEVILKETVKDVAKEDGLNRYLSAGGESRVLEMISREGEPDMANINDLLHEIFDKDQASSIFSIASEKYENNIVQEKDMDDMMSIVSEAASIPSDISDDVNIEKFARILQTDGDEIMSLITEARKIRMAMGKMGPERSQENEPQTVVTHTTPSVNIEPPANLIPVSEASPLPEAPKAELTLDMEISDFIKRQNEPSSLDIMDFTRYLKNKGYCFEENTVLEKIYLGIEDRKRKDREKVLEEIERFLEKYDYPSEDQIGSFIESLKNKDIRYGRHEIKSMINLALLSK
ncbi:hypothetical protein CUJ83_13115 [Methanocella sp. CWC-04]|uniref:Uncharacterized protein n=1 Tax=Methanooceanicella nereidis TaxID=2052831 RepID=A0AAP2RE08_9EURY|nr:hypothetical protein [Methanocella sp. CWC-04]MCD1295936.1 hypothetical protein [Methanocella sp. CWC-04]